MNLTKNNMFAGMMLSDGHIKKFKSKTGRTTFELKQSPEHKDLIDKVESKFNNLKIKCNVKTSLFYNKTEKKTYETILLSTRANREFGNQRRRWYPNGIKIVPKDLKLNPEIIAYWTLGDGGVWRGGKDKHSIKFSFYTNSFTLEDVNFLRDQLRELGIESTLYIKRNVEPIIQISTASSVTKLMDMIKPYMIPCFQYKIQYPALVNLGNAPSRTAEAQKEYYHNLEPEVKQQRNHDNWAKRKDTANPERKDKYHSNPEFREICKARSNKNYTPHPRIREITPCIFCKSNNTRKHGKITTQTSFYERVKCNDCKHLFQHNNIPITLSPTSL